jgi:hypothetical protein
MLKIGLLNILVFILSVANAQISPIKSQDNQGLMQGYFNYVVINDSLVITSKSDYVRSNVEYLKLTSAKSEKNSFSKFIFSFPLDSIQLNYFNQFANFNRIDSEHCPRVFSLNMNIDDTFYGSKCTNAYVCYYARIIDAINPLLKNQVKVPYDKQKFNAFY